MNGVCSVCGETRFVLEHHINYIPEKKIDVCMPCHKKLHRDNPQLKPPDGFYQNDKIGYTRATLYLEDELDKKVRHAIIDAEMTFSDAIAEGAKLWLETRKKKG